MGDGVCLEMRHNHNPLRFGRNTAKVRLNSCYSFFKHEAKFWSSCAGGPVNFDQSV